MQTGWSGRGSSRTPEAPKIRQEWNVPPHPNLVYDNEIVAEAVNRIGGGSATATTRAIGASGNVAMPVLSFSNTGDNYVNFTFHVPEDLCPDYTCDIKMMWVPAATWTTGNFYFHLEYLVKDEDGGVTTTGTPTTVNTDLSTTAYPALSATVMREDTLATGLSLGPDQTVTCYLLRDVSEDNGDAPAQVRYFELHYKAYRAGTKLHPSEKPW